MPLSAQIAAALDAIGRLTFTQGFGPFVNQLTTLFQLFGAPVGNGLDTTLAEGARALERSRGIQPSEVRRMTPRQIAARLFLDHQHDLREMQTRLALQALASSQNGEAIARQIDNFKRDLDGV